MTSGQLTKRDNPIDLPTSELYLGPKGDLKRRTLLAYGEGGGAALIGSLFSEKTAPFRRQLILHLPIFEFSRS